MNKIICFFIGHWWTSAALGMKRATGNQLRYSGFQDLKIMLQCTVKDAI